MLLEDLFGCFLLEETQFPIFITVKLLYLFLLLAFKF